MKKILVGTVVSNKMKKTIVVAVDGFIKHRLYKKQVKQVKRYYVHDESEMAKVGDLVEIQESRPRSKKKRWELVKVIGGK